MIYYLQTIKNTLQKNNIRTFLNFYSIPSIATLFIWWVKNARNRSADTDFFPLLFNKFHLFSDWKVTVLLSELNNPWQFIGSKWEGILPPSFYGPSTYGFIKIFNSLPLLGSYSKNQNNLVIDTFHHAIFLSLALATCYVTLRIFSKNLTINRKDILFTENKFNIYLIGIFFSFPILYAAQRGSSSIFAALMVSLSAMYLGEKKYLKMTIFIAIAATSQFQLIPLTAVLFLPRIFKYGKYGIAYISLNYFFVIYLTSYKSLLATYKLNKSLFIRVTDYSHDLQSGIINLEYLNSKFPFLYLFIGILLIIFIFYLIKSKKNNQNIIQKSFESNNFDFTQYVASKIFFLAISSSLLLANPSFDYHLVRLIPAFALLIVLNESIISKLSIASFAVTISYLRLWGFLYSKDLAVPIRTICIILISIEVIFNLLTLLKDKQLTKAKT